MSTRLLSAYTILAFCCLVTVAAFASTVQASGVPNQGTEVSGVMIYYKTLFNNSQEGWLPANEGKLSITEDAVDGKVLRVACDQSWAGARLPISVIGSRGLKIALHMRGRNLPSVGINVFDTISNDNTTSYGYRYLRQDRWIPALYFLDRFRYNSRTAGFVSARTAYNRVQFYGPFLAEPGRTFLLDNFIMYRGVDKQPPGKVTGLKAKATDGGVLLCWNPATDNVAPQVYVIARAPASGEFQKIAESYATSHLDDTAGTQQYRYRVLAVDFEENIGPWSDSVVVNSISTPGGSTSTREEKDRIEFAEHVRQVHTKGVGRMRKGHATLFGDSLTGATSYPQCAQAAFRNLTVNAFGYPRMKTSFGRNKVGEILQKESPEFMFILFGTNNRKKEQDIPAAMEDLAAIVKTCKANGTVAVVGTIPPRGWSPDSAPEANFNKNIIELCHRLKTPVGYIFEDFQAAGDRRRYMGSDGVHWRGAGMEIAAQAWGKTLEQIRFVLRDRD